MAEQRWQLTVNEKKQQVEAAADTPLLYVLQNELGLKGPRFGCGLAQCGSCSVLVDGREVRACATAPRWAASSLYLPICRCARALRRSWRRPIVRRRS